MKELRKVMPNEYMKERLEKSRKAQEAAGFRHRADIFYHDNLLQRISSRTALFQEQSDAEDYIKRQQSIRLGMIAYLNREIHTENLSGILEDELIDREADNRVKMKKILKVTDEHYGYDGKHHMLFELEDSDHERYIHRAMLDRFDNFLTEAGKFLNESKGKEVLLEFTATKGTDNEGFHHITRVKIKAA